MQEQAGVPAEQKQQVSHPGTKETAWSDQVPHSAFVHRLHDEPIHRQSQLHQEKDRDESAAMPDWAVDVGWVRENRCQSCPRRAKPAQRRNNDGSEGAKPY